jgi:hypothetical protein
MTSVHEVRYLGISIATSVGLHLKCDGTRAETRFRLSAKRTSPFKSAGTSFHSTTGSRVVRISCSNGGYTMMQSSVKGAGYPLHSPVSTSLPLSCVTVYHHVSTGLYQSRRHQEVRAGRKHGSFERHLLTRGSWHFAFFTTGG